MNGKARQSIYISPTLLVDVFDDDVVTSSAGTFESYDNEQNIGGSDLFF